MVAGNRASAVDDIVRQNRTLIRERSLGVGDVLPMEVELAAMVREAFRTLKANDVAESRRKIGAVLIDQHQSAMRILFSFISEISVDAFRDIQGCRRLTEMNPFDLLASRLTGETL